MQYLLAPFRRRAFPEFPYHHAFRRAQLQFPINRLGGLNHCERYLQPEVPAKNNFASLQQRFSVRRFLTESHPALQFIAHAILLSGSAVLS